MKNIKYILINILLILYFLISCTASNHINNLAVHYIDVGQGDCILIQVNNKNLLIDSGPSNSREAVTEYLKNIKIKRLDYIIATHPHEDHIGNMASIIKRYEVGEFYAPKVTHTSKTFENMVSALIDKNKKINVLSEGCTSINLGKNTLVSVFSPQENKYSDNLNDYSPIIKIQFLNTSFLFTGDSETNTENEVLSKNYNLKSDVLKVSHHGSSTSTSENFLKAVNPSAAIISVGKNNSYGHPSIITLETLKKYNIPIYRSDILGNIILISDGKNIKINSSKSSYK